MKKVCAWCEKTMVDDPRPDAEVTHGICRRCAKQIFHQLKDSDGLLTGSPDLAPGRAGGTQPYSRNLEEMLKIWMDDTTDTPGN